MKSSLFLVAVFLSASLSTAWAEPAPGGAAAAKPKTIAASGEIPANALYFSDGGVYHMKDGAKSKLAKSKFFSSGVTVTATGKVTFKDGATAQLEEGQMIDEAGVIGRIPGPAETRVVVTPGEGGAAGGAGATTRGAAGSAMPPGGSGMTGASGAGASGGSVSTGSGSTGSTGGTDATGTTGNTGNTGTTTPGGQLGPDGLPITSPGNFLTGPNGQPILPNTQQPGTSTNLQGAQQQQITPANPQGTQQQSQTTGQTQQPTTTAPGVQAPPLGQTQQPSSAAPGVQGQNSNTPAGVQQSPNSTSTSNGSVQSTQPSGSGGSSGSSGAGGAGTGTSGGSTGAGGGTGGGGGGAGGGGAGGR